MPTRYPYASDTGGFTAAATVSTAFGNQPFSGPVFLANEPFMGADGRASENRKRQKRTVLRTVQTQPKGPLSIDIVFINIPVLPQKKYCVESPRLP